MLPRFFFIRGFYPVVGSATSRQPLAASIFSFYFTCRELLPKVNYFQGSLHPVTEQYGGRGGSWEWGKGYKDQCEVEQLCWAIFTLELPARLPQVLRGLHCSSNPSFLWLSQVLSLISMRYTNFLSASYSRNPNLQRY